MAASTVSVMTQASQTTRLGALAAGVVRDVSDATVEEVRPEGAAQQSNDTAETLETKHTLVAAK